MKRIGALLCLSCFALAAAQGGVVKTYSALLFGSGGVPTTAGVIGNTGSNGFGFVDASFDVDQSLLTITNGSVFFVNSNATAFVLTSPATGGNTGPTQLTLAGIPSATSGNPPTQSFVLSLAQATDLQAGSFYALVKSANLPLGEIGGALTQTGQFNNVPEPSTAILSALGLGLLWMGSRRLRLQP
jgi:hypothetical protein